MPNAALLMGITGLLQFLKGALQKDHLQSFSHKRVAVDAMTWLHIGLYVQHPEVQMSEFGVYSYLVYAIRMIKLLRYYDITPVFVLDGKHLGNKKETAEKRQQARDHHYQIAEKLIKDGLYEAAERYFVRSQAITSDMVNAFIDLIKACSLRLIVAPGEADPQLAYLLQIGEVDYVISEDSDTIAFGCTKVIYKLKTNGKCHYFDHAKLTSGICADYTLIGRFSRVKLSLMCVLAGCDYVGSLKGVGPKKAMELVWKSEGLGKLWRALSFMPKLKTQVTEEYKEKVTEALRFFLYYPVYDPRSGQLVPLSTEPSELSPPPLLTLPVSDLRQYASGDIDIRTYQVRTHFADTSLLLKMYKRFKIPKCNQDLVFFEFKTPVVAKRKRESEVNVPLPEITQEDRPTPLKRPKENPLKTPAEIYQEVKDKIALFRSENVENEVNFPISAPELPENPAVVIKNPFKSTPKSSLFSPKFEILSNPVPKTPKKTQTGQLTLESSFQSSRKSSNRS